MKIAETPFYRRNKSLSQKFGAIFVNLILLIAGTLSLMPLVHILAVSLSATGPANANMVNFIPVGFNLNSYTEAIKDPKMLTALMNTIYRTAIGVPFNMLMTIICAYPLSIANDKFPLRRFYSGFIVFTMLFSGGLIPSYILILNLGLMNNIWALILPGVPVFHVIIMMNFFRRLPVELREAAIIDGADHITTLTKIYLPLSGAVLATLTLFCFVFHWNAWFDALMYMRNLDNMPLQNYIQSLIVRMNTSPDLEEARRLALIARRSLLFARIFISLLPIMLLFPFIQKYFQRGIVLGAIKG